MNLITLLLLIGLIAAEGVIQDGDAKAESDNMMPHPNNEMYSIKKDVQGAGGGYKHDMAKRTDRTPMISAGGAEQNDAQHLQTQQPLAHVGRKLNIKTNQRWKDRVGDVVTVPFSIDGDFTEDARSLIEESVNEIWNLTRVVRFTPRTNQAAYVSVVNDADGCWSPVGKQSDGKVQQLHLAAGCLTVRTIQHEFMHALGFHHEHTRPDRDSYVTIYWDNIVEKNRHNFDIATSDMLGSEYDYLSAMHYSTSAFAIDGNSFTITPKQAGYVLGGDNMTDWDVIKIRLLYQCLSGPRTNNAYVNNPCTPDCKCWEGFEGCTADDQCQGQLICNDYGVCATPQCEDYTDWIDWDGDNCTFYRSELQACEIYGNYTGNSTFGEVTAMEACCHCGGGFQLGGSANGTSQSGCTDTPLWFDVDGDDCSFYEETENSCQEFGYDYANAYNGKTASEACCHCGGGSLAGVTLLEFRSQQSPELCMDLVNSITTNGNFVSLYPCDGSPAQRWWIDSNSYFRSALNTDKCIVGADGALTVGTNLIINDCQANDERFVFTYWTDASITPENYQNLCFGPSLTESTPYGYPVIELSICSSVGASPHQMWTASEVVSRRRRLGDQVQEDRAMRRDLQGGECTDVPLGWYDATGDNCEFYSQGDRCVGYGGSSMNFGKTANQACCVCGGGSSVITPDYADSPLANPVPVDSQTCWDILNWRDSVGDGCTWYAQGDNCAYYGNDFSSVAFGTTANQACCACGGGSSMAPPELSDFPDPGCSDSPSRWVDADGDTCAFYAQKDNCDRFGNDYLGTSGKTAKEACCACGGGYDPNRNSQVDSSVVATTKTAKNSVTRDEIFDLP